MKPDKSNEWMYKRWRPGRRSKFPPKHLDLVNLRKKAEKIKAAKQMVYGDKVSWADAIGRLGIRSYDTLRTYLYQDLQRLEIADQEGKDAFDPMPEEEMVQDLDAVTFCEHVDFLNMPLFPMQKLIMKAFYGLDMTDEEQTTLERLVKEGKCTWKGKKEYRELVLDMGMKSGKTVLGGSIACWEEHKLWRLEDPAVAYGFPSGEEIYILNVATDKDQAAETIFAKIRARINNSRFYKTRRLREGFEELLTAYRFPNNVKMQSGHSNSDSLVGRCSIVVLFDELARFKDKKTGKFSGHRVYYSLTRNTAPFKDKGKVISTSSPIHSKDMISRLFKISADVENMLGFHLSTWEVNPNLPFECDFLQSELKKSPEDFWRDYGARPPESVEAYYRMQEKIDDVFKLSGRRNPLNSDGTFAEWFRGKPGVKYYIHGDPAVRNDAFGIGLAHRENGHIILDLAMDIEPPTGGEIDQAEVKTLFMSLAERFRLGKASFDTWQSVELSQALAKAGVPIEHLLVDKLVHDVFKGEVYSEEHPLKTYGNAKLREQLKGLQLVNGRKVDHPDGEAKDLADAAAGAVYHAANIVQTSIASGSLEPGAKRKEPKKINDKTKDEKREPTSAEQGYSSSRLVSGIYRRGRMR